MLGPELRLPLESPPGKTAAVRRTGTTWIILNLRDPLALVEQLPCTFPLTQHAEVSSTAVLPKLHHPSLSPLLQPYGWLVCSTHVL